MCFDWKPLEGVWTQYDLPRRRTSRAKLGLLVGSPHVLDDAIAEHDIKCTILESIDIARITFNIAKIMVARVYAEAYMARQI